MAKLTDTAALRERLGLPPQAERRHFVFLHRCGCPFGLTEWRAHRGRLKGVTNEDEAWDDMYDTRAEERAARARGVRVVLVDHATYVREFYPQMSQRCPHLGGVVSRG